MRFALPLLLFAAAAHAEPLSPAARLVGAALVEGRAFDTVRSLTDHVGPRLTGSPGAERAVEWALAEMKRAGLSNVHREPVKVPRWVRGDESAELVAPLALHLHAAALGGSVGTPPGGLTAEVIEAGSLDELRRRGEAVRGRIVLFNQRMARSDFPSYGTVVPLRGAGAVEAARLGAIGALIRSVGTGSHQLPHTGGTRYDAAVPRIPYAAVSGEDADLLHRLLGEGGQVKVRLRLGAHDDGEVDSANVVGELPGSAKPDEVVLLGAHLDSWDLGTGAIDDGAGCAAVIEAARLIRAAGLQPRRTVRVVLFMNEEHGLSGARAYAEAHRGESGKHVAALEADSGAGRPTGFGVAGGAPSVELVRRLVAALSPLHAAEVASADEGGADLIPLQEAGVPVIGLTQDMSTYFDWHHTAGDTLDKIVPDDLALDAAAVAVVAYGLADATERLPPSPPPPKW